MKLYFNKDVYFVKGYKNAAIYDNNKEKVYSVDEYGKEIIEKMLKEENIELEVEKNYLENLKKLELISTTPNSSDTEAMVPAINLEYAWLEITESCNLRCVHCYGQFGCPKIKKEKILSTNEWKKIIDELIKNRCYGIQLIGGEPIIHPNFYEILEYAHKQGMKRIDVFTNGTLINEASIDIFKRTRVNLRVSVYGHNAKIHDSITQQKGSFEKNKKALHLLKENNIPTTIAVVIMKENEKYIENIKQYIINLGHKYNGYDVIRPSCITDKKDHSITNIDILNSRYNVKPVFWTRKSDFVENHFYNPCWRGKIAITSEGKILPCIFARDNIIGDIKIDKTEELKEKIINAWKYPKDNVETCKDCEFRYCCHDCRPLAKAINGTIDSKYPRCCYNPYTGIWEDIKKCNKEIGGYEK